MERWLPPADVTPAEWKSTLFYDIEKDGSHQQNGNLLYSTTRIYGIRNKIQRPRSSKQHEIKHTKHRQATKREPDDQLVDQQRGAVAGVTGGGARRRRG